jgi:hypothetical protein
VSVCLSQWGLRLCAVAHIQTQHYTTLHLRLLQAPVGALYLRLECPFEVAASEAGDSGSRHVAFAVPKSFAAIVVAERSRDGVSDEATTRLTPPQSRTALELARRLLARDAPVKEAPDAVAAATEQVCGRVSASLSRWFGIDGTNALFARALVQAQADHPALANVRYSRQSAVCLERLAENARIHGADAAADGVAAILTALIELLGRLIGQDIAMRLVEQSVPAEAPDDARATGEENQR